MTRPNEFLESIENGVLAEVCTVRKEDASSGVANVCVCVCMCLEDSKTDHTVC